MSVMYSDYTGPTYLDLKVENLANMLIWLNGKTGKKTELWIHDFSVANYFLRSTAHLEKISNLLALACDGANDDIIYNGRDKTARKLADWWDLNKEIHYTFLERQSKIYRAQKKLDRVLSKLTLKDIYILTSIWGVDTKIDSLP